MAMVMGDGRFGPVSGRRRGPGKLIAEFNTEFNAFDFIGKFSGEIRHRLGGKFGLFQHGTDCAVSHVIFCVDNDRRILPEMRLQMGRDVDGVMAGNNRLQQIMAPFPVTAFAVFARRIRARKLPEAVAGQRGDNVLMRKFAFAGAHLSSV